MSDGTLPRGWRMASLAEVATTCAGGTPKAKTPAYYEGGDIPWLKIGDLNDGEVFGSEQAITQAGFDASAAKWVHPGAVLVAMYGSIGKLGILCVRATTNQAICAVTPNPEHLTTEWLYWVLRSQRAALDRLGRGGTQRNISQGDLKTWPIPVPPIDEQIAIVAAIEDAFARIDEVEAELTSVEHLNRRLALKIRRQAVDIEGGNGLPRGWRVMRLADIAENLDKRRVPVNRKEREVRMGEVPYYGATGRVGWIDKALFDEDLVLLGEDGVSFLDPAASKAYRIDGPAWVNNHAHVLRPKRGVVTHAFLCLALNHIDYTGRVNGTTRLKLTQAQMNDLPIPVPPLNEQKDVVAAVDDAGVRIAAVNEATSRAKTDLVALRASVLHRAFTGELLAIPASEKESAAA